jgi:hypothetical protein
MKATSACPACGAALAPGAERCDLCGTTLGEAPAATPEPASALVEATQPPPAVPPAAAPQACATCGHLNPAGARFCNQCGATLAGTRPAAPASPEPPAAHAGPAPAPAKPAAPAAAVAPGLPPAGAAARPPSDPGRRALTLVGLGVAAVLGLYLITQSSRQAPSPPDPSAAADQPRLTAAPAALPDSLRDRVAALEDEGTPASLDDAGGLLYRAAAALPPDDPQRAALAQQAVDLYERSLDLEDDPDVRVNLAVAALLDPRNPMRAVQELQAVLTAHPDHVEANFNMGLMRMQIGRLDAAAESFRRVIALTRPDDPVHRQATEALAAVEGAMAQQRPAG